MLETKRLQRRLSNRHLFPSESKAITLWFKSRLRVTEVGVTVGGTVNKLTVAPQTHGAGASTNVTVVRFSDDSSSNGFERSVGYRM